MSTLSLRRGLFAGLAVTAVAGASFASTAGHAFADPTIPDPNATANLLVHKYQGPATNLPNNGTAQTVNAPAMEGVEFTTYRVFTDAAHATPVDLTTNAGWQAASVITGYTLTPADIAAGQFTIGGTTYYLGTGTEKATGADGTADFSNMPLGLYLTNESVEGGDTITVHNTDGTTKTIKGSQVSGVTPFFTTLPMTQPDTTDTWMYTVNAYPKNSVDSINKAVTDKGAITTSDNQTGGAVAADAPHAVDYTTTSSIPTQTAADIGTYVIQDKLDARSVGQSVAVTVGGTTLTRGTDYQVYVNDAAWDGNAMPAGAKIEVVITGSGLTAMKAAQANDNTAQVTAVFGTQTQTEGNGDIPNTALLMPSNAWWTTNTGNTTPYNPTNDDVNNPGTGTTPTDTITSNRVDTLYGDLNITKTGDGNTPLAGAVFSVYQDKTPDGSCTSASDEGALLVSGVTTGADGKATVRGLQASNFNNGAYQQPASQVTYCLMETKAPAGYNLLAQPIGFVITASGDADGGYTVTPAAESVTDQLSNLGNNMPLTGGQGAAIGTGAVVVVALGGAYVVMRRRQDKADA